MKVNKKILFMSIFISVAALAYFFSSFLPLETELHLTPEWTVDIGSVVQSAEDGETLFPFRLGRNLGYFTKSGKITLNERVPYKATISRNLFALYDADAENTVVYDNAGKERCVIDGAGFPFIQQDRIFLLPPGGASLAFIDGNNGTQKALYEHTSPITSLTSSEKGVSAGFADGDFLIFEPDGKLRASLSPGGSEFSAIYGGAISNDGNMFACVSGLEPQRLVLYRDEGTYKKIVFHEFLKTSLLRQTYMHFSENDKFVYFDSNDSLVIVDTERLESIHIPLTGMILNIQESPVNDTVFVLSRDAQSYTVTILEQFKRRTGDFSFDAQTAFILAEGDSLFVGRDNKISRIAISKE